MAPSFEPPALLLLPPQQRSRPPLLLLLAVGLLATLPSAPWAGAAPAPVRYDQRQTGTVNVQVDLKDVEIYAILDESLLSGLGVGEYDYDYSQLTEKPPATPPPKPGNATSTAKPSSTAAPTSSTSKRPSVRTTEPEPARLDVAERSSPSASIEASPTKEQTPAASRVVAPAPTKPAAPPAPPSPARLTVSSANPVKISVAHRRCGAGYHRDASGRCRRDRRPLLKYALKRRPVSRSSPAAAAPAAASPPPAAAVVPQKEAATAVAETAASSPITVILPAPVAAELLGAAGAAAARTALAAVDIRPPASVPADTKTVTESATPTDSKIPDDTKTVTESATPADSKIPDDSKTPNDTKSPDSADHTASAIGTKTPAALTNVPEDPFAPATPTATKTAVGQQHVAQVALADQAAAPSPTATLTSPSMPSMASSPSSTSSS